MHSMAVHRVYDQIVNASHPSKRRQRVFHSIKIQLADTTAVLRKPLRPVFRSNFHKKIRQLLQKVSWFFNFAQKYQCPDLTWRSAWRSSASIFSSIHRPGVYSP
jgi:hypothetical protein